MPTEVTQIEPNGSTVVDFDPPHTAFEDQEEVVRQGLANRGWAMNVLTEDKQKRYRLIEIQKANVTFKVALYIFPNLAWSSGNRSHDEKRIQLSRPYEEHAADFALAKDGDPRCALLGIYHRGDALIFCAWDAGAYKNHPNPNSCYVRTSAMASAARSGFGQSVDAKERLVCCFTPDMLAYYLENMAFLHDNVVLAEELISPAPEHGQETSSAHTKLTIETNTVPEDLPHNRLLYGAPGTGKSHNLDEDLKEYFPDEQLFERAVFHPETTNGVFVGEYRPTPVYRKGDGTLLAADRRTSVDDLEPIIDYRFVPGPFLRILARAYNNPKYSFCLVIEEINRAQAAGVFGEVFQMLDRDDVGVGRFPVIFPDEAQNYLASHGITGAVTLPSNLYLWATMNSADQGVLPLDAAFKRRWSLEYVGLNEGERVVAEWNMQLRFLDTPIKWNTFRRALNAHLQTLGVAEDRMLGPFFMTQKDLGKAGSFENKILHYLREDVVRSTPDRLFTGGSLSYGALVEAYLEGGNIFVPEIEFVAN